MAPSGVYPGSTSMASRIPQSIRRLRSVAPRRGYRQVDWTEPEPDHVAQSDEERAREAGGPEDMTVYTCSCGMVFRAPVSASVACPHCGDQQDW
jgi:cytochrome c5